LLYRRRRKPYTPALPSIEMLVEGDGHLFDPGMSFSIEPNLTLQNEGFGLKMGETVVCTEKGAPKA
jgi:Xaa-Pro dipeptidase